MSHPSPGTSVPELLAGTARSEWVRLRTLTNLRWMAVAGQTAAVLLARFQLGIQLDVAMCLVAIGASVLFNIAAIVIYPENKRLSERETTVTLLFDLAQLVFLLFLSGGLNNPFALLLLAPVTIGATTLGLRPTLFLGAATMALVTFLWRFHVPMIDSTGRMLVLPPLFQAGFWVSLNIGVVFLAIYARRVAEETSSMSQALLATQMALAREQKLTDLGGIVAAAAHELGTPLATIKLVSSEMAEELADRPDLREDALLIRQQADRCRDILRDMGRTGKDDMQMHYAPVTAVVREAAEPHEGRGKPIHFSARAWDGALRRQPVIRRQPEIIHGIRNLVQNAVDFAAANVWVDIRWNERELRVTVADDGPGYPTDLLGRIGDPFVRQREGEAPRKDRPGYEGMGLGLFIAKTLLERSGAELTFANGRDPFLNIEEIPLRSGAIVEVLWQRADIEQPEDQAHGPLGENTPLKI